MNLTNGVIDLRRPHQKPVIIKLKKTGELIQALPYGFGWFDVKNRMHTKADAKFIRRVDEKV